MTWDSKTTVKKGDIGESIVDAYLIKRGYIPYAPNYNGAHPFDRLCASMDKKKIFIADVKAKAKRKYYPDTGINIKHYNDYQNISVKYGIDVFIYFVDEEVASIYGGSLRVLARERQVQHKNKTLTYPIRAKGIIYFPCEVMTVVSSLTPDEISDLKQYTTKNIAYTSEVQA